MRQCGCESGGEWVSSMWTTNILQITDVLLHILQPHQMSEEMGMPCVSVLETLIATSLAQLPRWWSGDPASMSSQLIIAPSVLLALTNWLELSQRRGLQWTGPLSKKCFWRSAWALEVTMWVTQPCILEVYLDHSGQSIPMLLVIYTGSEIWARATCHSDQLSTWQLCRNEH